MPTKTSSNTKSGGGLLVAALLVVALGLVYGLGKRPGGPDKDDDKEESVVFTVAFNPPKRLTYVIISVVANNVLVVDKEKTKVSPWNRTFPIKKGQNITLTATQEVPSRLACAVNGVQQESTEFAGSIVCIYS